MDQQTVPPAPVTTQTKVSKFPKLNKKSIIIILAVATLTLLIPLILLAFKKQTPQQPVTPKAKTWEIILGFDNKTEALSLKKLSVLNQEILADFRSAALSPYELVVLDKDDRALFRTKVNITEQILYNLLNEPVSSGSSQLSPLSQSLETTLYIPFKPSAAKISISKYYSPLLQVNITPEVAFSLVPEALAQTPPQSCGAMQIVFISDGYTNFNQFHSDIEQIKNAFSTTQPYSGKNIFDYKIIDNSQALGCSSGIGYCMQVNSGLIRQIGYGKFPQASKFIVLVNAPVPPQNESYLGITNDIGGDIAIFTNRTDIPPGEFTKTAVHEFLGHAVGLLYDRYVSVDPNYGKLSGSIRSNCTEKSTGEVFWKSAGSNGVFQGCSNQNYFASSSPTCTSKNPYLISAGSPFTIMSASSCSASGFDSVEQAWINQNVIPLYQTSCQQPTSVPVSTSAPVPTTFTVPVTNITPNPNLNEGFAKLGGFVFIDSNQNGKYEIGEGGETGVTILLNDGAASAKTGLGGAGTGGGTGLSNGGGFYFSGLNAEKVYTVTIVYPESKITTMDGAQLNYPGNPFNFQLVAKNKIALMPGGENYGLAFGIIPEESSGKILTIPTQKPIPSSTPTSTSESSGNAATPSNTQPQPTSGSSPNTFKTYICEEVPVTGGSGSQVQLKTLQCH